jgi:hypothetical protein
MPSSVVAGATATAGEVGSSPEVTRPAVSSTGGDTGSAECPLGGEDGPPEYCPISMAHNAFSKMIGYFHSSEPSR